jgi:hypothetical protein
VLAVQAHRVDWLITPETLDDLLARDGGPLAED